MYKSQIESQSKFFFYISDVKYVGTKLEYCLLQIQLCKEFIQFCDRRAFRKNYCCRSKIFFQAAIGKWASLDSELSDIAQCTMRHAKMHELKKPDEW